LEFLDQENPTLKSTQDNKKNWQKNGGAVDTKNGKLYVFVAAQYGEIPNPLRWENNLYIIVGSIWIPGAYPTNRTKSECNSRFPRTFRLWVN